MNDDLPSFKRGSMNWEREFFIIAGSWLSCRLLQLDPGCPDRLGCFLGEMDNAAELGLVLLEEYRSRKS
jgi:hypothetical protein